MKCSPCACVKLEPGGAYGVRSHCRALVGPHRPDTTVSRAPVHVPRASDFGVYGTLEGKTLPSAYRELFSHLARCPKGEIGLKLGQRHLQSWSLVRYYPPL